MPYFTVFTPTFNRAYILPQLYHSLCEQSCKDFEWLIVDDGSSDQTGELIARWKERENGFVIRCYRHKFRHHKSKWKIFLYGRF